MNRIVRELIPAVGTAVVTGTFLFVCAVVSGCAAAPEPRPSYEELRATLQRLGAPVRFSELGISRELFRETIANAHTVRPRYTVLTLLEELGLTGRYLPQLEEQFY